MASGGVWREAAFSEGERVVEGHGCVAQDAIGLDMAQTPLSSL